MKKILTQGRLAALIVLLVLVIDQVIKICVKTGMYLHEHIRITDWFYIYFTENNGMAFGMEFLPKLLLTLFRIVAVAFILWYLYKITNRKEKLKTGYVVCLAFILAGAVGNIIDCVFYGEVFSESTSYALAHWVPVGEGYGTWLHGKVVDMFYFPIIDTYWPEWMPFCGGERFIFFSPIFNFADASISCGMIALLLFYSHTLGQEFQHSEEAKEKDKSA
ncbi:lipoprotein signal peptidase [Bacteroides gallinaceum]|uniref:lipoprotein signal peptidase n=1 Tax=Bacteroides gallinaceum TaxID=1462571 RepID=UPI0015A93900|nr:lipoprotein signal peptidase [Bacteroides gallinaceum]MDM8153045.1 lipoprotein signal peptidase [Bacteroides gallinaceum]